MMKQTCPKMARLGITVKILTKIIKLTRCQLRRHWISLKMARNCTALLEVT